MQLLHEVWTSAGESSSCYCLAGPDGDSVRRLLARDATLIHTFEAGSRLEAAQIYYKLMGWGEYRPEPSTLDEFREAFTLEELKKQQGTS